MATSTRPIDDAIAAFAMAEGVQTYRGDADDVAARCLNCADAFGFDAVVRISGDSPFIDYHLIDACVNQWCLEAVDIVTNVFPRTYPSGLSVEVFGREALRTAMAETTAPSDREHVTRYFYSHPEQFRIRNCPATSDIPTEPSLAIDTEADLERAAAIIARLGERPEQADWKTVLALVHR